jgi:hypothetical protein
MEMGRRTETEGLTFSGMLENLNLYSRMFYADFKTTEVTFWRTSLCLTRWNLEHNETETTRCRKKFDREKITNTLVTYCKCGMALKMVV